MKTNWCCFVESHLLLNSFSINEAIKQLNFMKMLESVLSLICLVGSFTFSRIDKLVIHLISGYLYTKLACFWLWRFVRFLVMSSRWISRTAIIWQSNGVQSNQAAQAFLPLDYVKWKFCSWMAANTICFTRSLLVQQCNFVFLDSGKMKILHLGFLD